MSGLDMAVSPAAPSRLQDCAALHDAFKGLMCDAKAVIQILGHRTYSQRCLIRTSYTNMLEEDLLQRLKSELHGNLQKAMLMWVRTHNERDVVLLRNALSSCMHKNDALIEILCFRSSQDLKSIANLYHSTFERSLQKDIEIAKKGSIRKIFLEYLRACRDDDDTPVDASVAKQDAKELHDGCCGGAHDDQRVGKIFQEETFIRILTTRSTPHLRAAFKCYEELYGHKPHKDIKKKRNGEFEKLIRAILKCIQNPPKYFSKVLYDAMNGLGTNDDALIRVLVTRAEVDMKDIKVEFELKYKKSLESAIYSDTSGKYRMFLLTII